MLNTCFPSERFLRLGTCPAGAIYMAAHSKNPGCSVSNELPWLAMFCTIVLWQCLSQPRTGRIKCVLCDSTVRDPWKLVPALPWTSPRATFPFADWSLYLFTGRNHSCVYHHMLRLRVLLANCWVWVDLRTSNTHTCMILIMNSPALWCPYLKTIYLKVSWKYSKSSLNVNSSATLSEKTHNETNFIAG